VSAGALGAVVNPAAGGGRAGKVWDALVAGDPRLAAVPVVRATDTGGARAELAALLDTGIERLIVCGGDGTAHLAANVVLDGDRGDRVALGIVPAGTGSDFSRAIGLRSDPGAALDTILTAEPKPVDVVRVRTDDGRSRYSLNVASAGISGLVDQAVEAAPSRGKLTYVKAVLAVFHRYEPVRCRVITDGEEFYDGPVLILAIANGQAFGKGMRIAPHARLDDGLADVVLVGPAPGWQLPFRLPQVFLGRHLGSRYVTWRRAARVRIEPADDLPPFDLDGEPYPSGPAEFDLLPGALRLLA
jgi:diacylglycerol kinase (ATP)